MMNGVVRSWFVVALSVVALGACGPSASTEELGQSQQALIEPIPLPTVTATVSVPPFSLFIQTLASNVRPTSIALDATNVYFTDTFNLNAQVAGLPRAGGTKTVFHQTTTLPSSLVRQGSMLYWVDFTSGSSDGGVWGAATSGSSAAFQISHRNDSVTSHQALAVYETGNSLLTHQTHVLFADAWTSKLYDLRLSLLGTTEVSLVPDAMPNYYPYSVAIDSSHIYFTHDTGGGLWRVPYAGGVPTQLVDAEERAPLVVEDGRIYFLRNGDIKTKPAAGGATTTFVDSVGTVTAMVAKNDFLYWACSSCNAISKKPLAGGAVTTVVSAQSNLLSLAVDATHVYFGTTSALKRVHD